MNKRNLSRLSDEEASRLVRRRGMGYMESADDLIPPYIEQAGEGYEVVFETPENGYQSLFVSEDSTKNQVISRIRKLARNLTATESSRLALQEQMVKAVNLLAVQARKLGHEWTAKNLLDSI